MIPLIEIKYVFHLINFFFILEFSKPKYSNLIIQKVINLSIVLWFFLFITNYFFNNLHDSLFLRNPSLYKYRGLSGFGPEPATSGVYILCVYLCFKLKEVYKLLLLLMLLLTATPLIFLIPFLVLQEKNYWQLAFIGMSAILLFVFLDIKVPSRLDFYIKAIKDIDFTDLNRDKSILGRLNGLITFLEELKYIFKGNLSLNQFTGSNPMISSGLFVLFNKIGVLMIFIPIILIKKINSISTLGVFLLFLVAGSGGHFMPLYYLLSKHEKSNIYFNSSL